MARDTVRLELTRAQMTSLLNQDRDLMKEAIRMSTQNQPEWKAQNAKSGWERFKHDVKRVFSKDYRERFTDSTRVRDFDKNYNWTQEQRDAEKSPAIRPEQLVREVSPPTEVRAPAQAFDYDRVQPGDRNRDPVMVQEQHAEVTKVQARPTQQRSLIPREPDLSVGRARSVTRAQFVHEVESHRNRGQRVERKHDRAQGR